MHRCTMDFYRKVESSSSLSYTPFIPNQTWYVYCYMVKLRCNDSELLPQELALGQQTNIHRCLMDFYKKGEHFFRSSRS